MKKILFILVLIGIVLFNSVGYAYTVKEIETYKGEYLYISEQFFTIWRKPINTIGKIVNIYEGKFGNMKCHYIVILGIDKTTHLIILEAVQYIEIIDIFNL